MTEQAAANKKTTMTELSEPTNLLLLMILGVQVFQAFFAV